MKVHRLALATAAAGAACLLVGVSDAFAATVTFTQVARENTLSVGQINEDVTPALSDDGRVAFAAQRLQPQLLPADALHFWKAGVRTHLNLTTTGRSDVTDVAVRSTGDVVFASRRTSGNNVFTGVYRTSTTGFQPVTLREDPLVQNGSGPKARFVAMSETGVVAYSTIVNGTGAVYRSTLNSAAQVLRSGNGQFFNAQALDVNNGGRSPCRWSTRRRRWASAAASWCSSSPSSRSRRTRRRSSS
jgi:hypothetical protein